MHTPNDPLEMLKAEAREEAPERTPLERAAPVLLAALEEMLAAKNSMAAVTARKNARAAIAQARAAGIKAEG